MTTGSQKIDAGHQWTFKKIETGLFSSVLQRLKSGEKACGGSQAPDLGIWRRNPANCGPGIEAIGTNYFRMERHSERIGILAFGRDKAECRYK
jgi:hypothetical protein